MRPLRSRLLEIGVIALLALAVAAILLLAHHLTTPPAHLRIAEPLPFTDTASAAHVEVVWYRIPLRLDETPIAARVLYLPSPMADLRVRLNGASLTPDLPFGAAGSISQYYPRYLTLPPTHLRAGDNELLLGVHKNRPQLPMPVAYLGTDAELRPAYQSRYLLKISFTWAIIFAMVTIAVIMGTVWLHRRHESYYAWVAVAQLMGTFRLAYFSVETIPLPLRLWDWLSAMNLCFWTVATAVFVLRYLDQRRVRLERGVVIATVVIGAGLLLLNDRLYYTYGVGLLYSLLFALWCYSITRLLAVVFRGDTDARCMLFAGLLLMLLAVHDLLLVIGLWQTEQGIYLPYGVGVGLIALSWVLLRGFLRSLETSERLTITLEQRVEDKHRELQENYRRLRQLEHERLLVAERERIMRDVHDGVGGQLLALLASVQYGELDRQRLTEELSGTVEDLQLTIHSLSQYGDALEPALALLRQRLARACQLQGVELRWRIDPLAQLPALGPERTLHIARIVQEAVTNALKHAQPRSITIRAGMLDDGSGDACVAVRDDGCGLAASSETSGNRIGLSNMRRRAELAGIELNIDSGDSGTEVSLRIPVPALDCGLKARQRTEVSPSLLSDADSTRLCDHLVIAPAQLVAPPESDA